MSPPIGKKKISRRKPGEKSFRNYFDDDTQLAIVNYQAEADIDKRKKIFVTEIMPAMDTLVENLINVYGFHVLYDSKTDLKNECLEFLYTVVGKFNAARGSKAFSYFNVVAKNWLTIRSKQNAKNVQTYVSLDDKDALSSFELDLIENHSIIPSCEDVVTEEEIKANLVKMLNELGSRAKTDNETACVEAITLLAKNIDDIDLLSKRAVMLYIREITGMSSKQLSIVLSSLKKHYRELKKNDEYRP
jgi:hypothetical protein